MASTEEQHLSRVRLDVLVSDRGLAASRARARDAIMRGHVKVDGQTVTKPSLNVPPESEITLDDPAADYVSRAGLKLEAALDQFAIAVEGRTAVDLGASTGGFTDVLLRRDAGFVHAVDVGRFQLHPSLAADPRVAALEATDARSLTPFPEPPSLLVIDVSFISLRLVLPPVVPLLAPDAALVALIKPQFEAGRAHVGRGGLVRDEAVQETVCERIRDLVVALGFTVRGLIPSPVEGGDGNREFLIGAVRGLGR